MESKNVHPELTWKIIGSALSLDSPYRADIVVDRTALIELKAVSEILPVHSAQVLTYLKLSRLPVALLINFDVIRLKDGIRRFVNTVTPETRAGQ